MKREERERKEKKERKKREKTYSKIYSNATLSRYSMISWDTFGCKQENRFVNQLNFISISTSGRNLPIFLFFRLQNFPQETLSQKSGTVLPLLVFQDSFLNYFLPKKKLTTKQTKKRRKRGISQPY